MGAWGVGLGSEHVVATLSMGMVAVVATLRTRHARTVYNE